MVALILFYREVLCLARGFALSGGFGSLMKNNSSISKADIPVNGH